MIRKLLDSSEGDPEQEFCINLECTEHDSEDYRKLTVLINAK